MKNLFDIINLRDVSIFLATSLLANIQKLAYIFSMSEEKKKIKWINKALNGFSFKRTKLWQNLTEEFDKNNRIFFAISHKIDKTEIVEEVLEDSREEATTATPKKRRKKIFNIIFFLLNMGLVFLVFWNFAHEQGGIEPLSTLFANSPKWRYIFIALALFLLTNIFNGLRFSTFIYSKTKKFRPIFGYKLGAYGRYYDLVTPMGSGGQPFEIYYLKKNGYSGEASTAIPLAKYMIWQITFSVLCTIVLIMYSHSLVTSPAVLVLAWVGLGIILALFLFVFFMSVTKRFGAGLVVGVLKLLAKLKIVKNYRSTLKKVLRFVKSYQFSIKSFVKSPWTIILSSLCTVGSLVCNSLIAYFVLRSFVTEPQMSWFDMVSLSLICECAVAIVPLPGGSGASELSFNALLGSLFPEGTLFWGVLIWRMLTYYLYIPQGWLIMLTDSIKKRMEKKSELKKLSYENISKIEENKKFEIQ